MKPVNMILVVVEVGGEYLETESSDGGVFSTPPKVVFTHLPGERNHH
jgi:hypothetical protein